MSQWLIGLASARMAVPGGNDGAAAAGGSNAGVRSARRNAAQGGILKSGIENPPSLKLRRTGLESGISERWCVVFMEHEKNPESEIRD
jgi:hypothetical protein